MVLAMEKPPQEKPPNTQALIQTEWSTIKSLQNMLSDGTLSVKEKTSVASVLAFHVNLLNKLLVQTGADEQFSEQTLGDYIRTVEPRIARHFRRDVRLWKRALTSRRS